MALRFMSLCALTCQVGAFFSTTRPKKVMRLVSYENGLSPYAVEPFYRSHLAVDESSLEAFVEANEAVLLIDLRPESHGNAFSLLNLWRPLVHVPSTPENVSIAINERFGFLDLGEKDIAIVVFGLDAAAPLGSLGEAALRELRFTNVYNGGGFKNVVQALEKVDVRAAFRNELKTDYLKTLNETNKDPSHRLSRESLTILAEWRLFKETAMRALEGTSWLSLTRPVSSKGENVFLGQMSAGMFAPTDLKCSINSMVTSIGMKIQPQDSSRNTSYSYDTSIRFIVEEGPCKGVHGILNMRGYAMLDPECSTRLTVWLTAGKARPAFLEDSKKWKATFGAGIPIHYELFDWALRKLYGVQYSGSMKFEFKERPKGGHGKTYADIIFVDRSLLITRNHRGSIVVSSRCEPPDKSRETNSHRSRENQTQRFKRWNSFRSKGS